MRNNDKHSVANQGTSENVFWDQGSLTLKLCRGRVVLLIGNKRGNPKISRDRGTIYFHAPLPALMGRAHK